MTRNPPLAAAVIVAAAGAATIAGAWGFELIGGLEPCPLCLEQRWPYYVGVPVAVFAAGLARAGRRPAAGIALALAALVMAYGAGLGVYHAGIEWAWWPGPPACSAAGGFSSDVGSLLESVQGVRVPSCTEATWRLAGLSLAGWNALISAALTVLAASGALATLRRPAP